MSDPTDSADSVISISSDFIRTERETQNLVAITPHYPLSRRKRERFRFHPQALEKDERITDGNNHVKKSSVVKKKKKLMYHFGSNQLTESTGVIFFSLFHQTVMMMRMMMRMRRIRMRRMTI